MYLEVGPAIEHDMWCVGSITAIHILITPISLNQWMGFKFSLAQKSGPHLDATS